jgi:hypothetical protein
MSVLCNWVSKLLKGLGSVSRNISEIISSPIFMVSKHQSSLAQVKNQFILII